MGEKETQNYQPRIQQNHEDFYKVIYQSPVFHIHLLQMLHLLVTAAKVSLHRMGRGSDNRGQKEKWVF